MIPIPCGYLFLSHNSLAFFITVLLRFSSEFICLVGIFCFLQSFQTIQKITDMRFYSTSTWCFDLQQSQNWEPLPALSPECCSVPETQQTGAGTHSWVYLPELCFSGCKCKLLSCKPKFLMGKTSENEGVCHDQVSVGAQSRLVLMGCSSCPWRWFYVQKFLSLSEKYVFGFPCVC